MKGVQVKGPMNSMEVVKPENQPHKAKPPEFNEHDFTGAPLKNVFIPNWNNKPEPQPPVVSLGGVGFLSHQNTAAIIAPPGSGKSSNMESMIGSFLNPNCDSLGWCVDHNCPGIILIDNEMPDADVWNSWYRSAKRAGLPSGAPMKNVVIAGLRAVPRLQQRLEVIEYLLDNNPCGLLLIDGAGDLVLDTNDLDQAIECRIWMREITVKYNLSILSTLHPNPGGLKPRGHQGSEICREAESVAAIKTLDGSVRMITTDFDYGKNRHNPKLSVGFRWSEMYQMFVSEDVDDIIAGQKLAKDTEQRSKTEQIAKSIFSGQSALKYSELTREIADKISKTEATAKRRIKDMEVWGIIEKGNDGYYRLKK